MEVDLDSAHEYQESNTNNEIHENYLIADLHMMEPEQLDESVNIELRNDENPQNEGDNEIHFETSSPSPQNVKDTNNIKCKNTNVDQKLEITQDEDDDGKTCPICLDIWTNVGDHRICALKCGHLFGLKCIKTWFSLHKQRNCPTCKMKASSTHIRYIYAKRLIAADVSELEEVKQKLEEVFKEKTKIQIELTKSICRNNSLELKVQKLKSELERFAEMPKSTIQGESKSVNAGLKVYMDKSLEICKGKGCRVLDYFSGLDLLVASAKSPHNLFSGFGVRKVDVTTYKSLSYLPLHTQPIRDICFHAENPWILSVSLDKTAKLIDINSNSHYATYTETSPLWSCCWDVNDGNKFYVGRQLGNILKFDIRHMNQPVETLDITGDMSPVVSIASVTRLRDEPPTCGGVLACKLSSLWFLEEKFVDYNLHSFPVEGPFTSMCYDNKNRRLLFSTRPSANVPFSRHHVCDFDVNTETQTLVNNTSYCLKGSASQAFLSRSSLFNHMYDSYVMAYQESNKCVCMWSATTGQQVSSWPAHNLILDIRGINTTNNLIAALTETKIEFFKFQKR